MSNINYKELLFIPLILWLTPITGAGVDIFVPSLPAILHHFATKAELVKLTVTVYLIAYGVAMLVWGVITDSYGRKKYLLIALVGFFIACLLVPLSTSIWMLLLFRILQGVFVAGSAVITRAYLTDKLQGEQLMKASNYVNIAWGIGPIVSPFIGGYLQAWFGWSAAFYFLAGYTLIGLIGSIFIFSETLPLEKRNRFHLMTIIGNYRDIAFHSVFISSAIILALLASFLYIFSVMGPFLIQVVLHYSPVDYGHFALLLGVFWSGGNITVRLLMKRFSLGFFMRAGITVMLLASFIMLILGSMFGTNIWLILIPTMFIFFSAGAIFPINMAKCISLFPKAAGSASALMGTCFIVGSGVMSGLASLVKSHHIIPLASFYFVLSLICCGIFYFGLRALYAQKEGVI